ncbi:MAG: hypothetical protein P1U42_11865 [Phycisphaerales bacterium]|nr:hypothetical protein [Phycisphaerales bacterium]
MNDKDESISYISTLDVRDAIDGDDYAIQRVAEKLSEASRLNRDLDDPTGSITRVQFVWHEPYGTKTSFRQFLFAGSLFSQGETVMLKDFRDEDSIGLGPDGSMWDEDSWTFWPTLSHRDVSHADKGYQNGALVRWWNVSLVGIFQLISVCFVGTWLVGFVVTLIGASKIKWRRARYGVFTVLLVFACVVGFFGVSHSENIHESYIQSGDLSGTYTIGYLDRLVADETKLIPFCQELLQLVPEGYESELLLAQSWASMEPVSGHDQLSYRHEWLSIGHFLILVNSGSYSFENTEESHWIRDLIDQSGWWKELRREGSISMEWGPIDRQSFLSFNLAGWLAIGVLLWLVWVTMHWVSRIVFRRVQQRRVKLKQCIFCRYPLTQEGLLARYPQVES